MNEYQDQATWFEVERQHGTQWEYVSDHDTETQAVESRDVHAFAEPETAFRVRRVRGLN